MSFADDVLAFADEYESFRVMPETFPVRRELVLRTVQTPYGYDVFCAGFELLERLQRSRDEARMTELERELDSANTNAWLHGRMPNVTEDEMRQCYEERQYVMEQIALVEARLKDDGWRPECAEFVVITQVD